MTINFNPHSLVPHPTLRHAKHVGLAGLAFLLLGGGLRLGLNFNDAQALQQRTVDSAQRTVTIVHPRSGEVKRSIDLPGTLRGGSETVIHARSAGYVAAWYKTIGDRVKKGELLARIDAPEQEQELAQAKAAREQIKVRAAQTAQTFERWNGLRAKGVVSLQDFEDKRATRDQATADLVATDANVRRLEQMEGFRRIVAPFDGVVTRRSIDVGNLISAGGKELFALAQTDPLRLSAWVPQAYAGEVREGQEVTIRLGEMPGSKFTARIEHVAGAIDATTRSRQIDVILPNQDGKLLPGSYVTVSLDLARSAQALIVPANVVILGHDGPRIATVDADQRVQFRPVKLGRDLGRELEVLGGISAQDALVSSPADALMEGEKVATRP